MKALTASLLLVIAPWTIASSVGCAGVSARPATAPGVSGAGAAAVSATAFSAADETDSDKGDAPSLEPHWVRHRVEVTLDPSSSDIRYHDDFSWGAALGAEHGIVIALHAELHLELLSTGATMQPRSVEEVAETFGLNGSGSTQSSVPLQHYSISWQQRPETLEFAVHGRIHHAVEAEGEEYARSFSRTPGIISEDGVVLSGSSWWLPSVVGGVETLTLFDMTVHLPDGWKSVSQGARTAIDPDSSPAASADRQGPFHTERWTCNDPMDEVYLIANRFHEFSRGCGSVTAYAFLRVPDTNLANKYLETTAQYLEMYRKLIGPYPYAKFALVENFWETGYGMPSFTLLGPQVIRFPFILHSSYPHEILHNWWGNSVFVDYESGNWCEGLTAYMADHLVQEGYGRGDEYRRNTLQKYRSYVDEGRDFPLTQFRSRHSSATEAVGYGKSLMLWHMLRQQLGDAKFQQALQRVYRRYRGKRASFADFEKVFSETAGYSLAQFFDQWVKRTGAPTLQLLGVTTAPGKVQLHLAQTQSGEPYQLRVPVALYREGDLEGELLQVELTSREQRLTLDVADAEKVLRVEVDPHFDLFRRLDLQETPPTLGNLFGSKQITIIVPAPSDGLSDGLAAEWRRLADEWKSGSTREDVVLQIVSENELQEFPASDAVWVLGAANRWGSAFESGLRKLQSPVERGSVALANTRYSLADHSYVFVLRHPQSDQGTIGWVGAPNGDAIAGLTRKLPHYGKYSYLGFQGNEPTNMAKGQWLASESPLIWSRAGNTVEAWTLSPRQPLARLAPVFDPERLFDHVKFLAADERDGRGVGTVGLNQSADYIEKAFQDGGLLPGGDNKGEGRSYRQRFTVEGPHGMTELYNIVGVLPGREGAYPGESVVVGAHYDHLGLGEIGGRAEDRGQIFNGADDNASGVAVLIELAKLLGASLEPDRSLVFVAFSGEEMGRLGSRHYVESMQEWPARQALAMVNLDSVGRLDGKPILVLGTGTATEWVHIARGVGFTTGVESKCVPNDPGGSDQVSFHEVGVPAVQIFSGANGDYHRPTDDIDKIDVDGMIQVATLVRESVVYLSEREKPLTSSLVAGTTPGTTPKRPEGGRKVSLGTIPAYGYTGSGVKIDGTVAGSPAASAGLQEGDILTAIDEHSFTDLASYARILGQYQPGDRIEIHFLRDGEEKRVNATLKAR